MLSKSVWNHWNLLNIALSKNIHWNSNGKAFVIYVEQIQAKPLILSSVMRNIASVNEKFMSTSVCPFSRNEKVK